MKRLDWYSLTGEQKRQARNIWFQQTDPEQMSQYIYVITNGKVMRRYPLGEAMTDEIPMKDLNPSFITHDKSDEVFTEWGVFTI